MLTWLENWLHGIIAVVLFAVIVELLLPNSKFVKYTRLVIGLILLITILSPVLKVFEKDYLTQIDASYALWEKQMNSQEIQTLSLRDIQAKARDLEQKNHQATLQVTSRAIAEQMIQQFREENVLYVAKLDVELKLSNSKTQVEPYINAVIVTLSKQAEQHAKESNASENSELAKTTDVIEVSPITIDVKEFSVASGENEYEKSDDTPNTAYSEDEIERVYHILQKQWNLKKNQISIVAEK